jgi:hypothetical protein
MSERGEKLFFSCSYTNERCLSIDLTIATGLIIRLISILLFVFTENLPCLFYGKVSQTQLRNIYIFRMTIG